MREICKVLGVILAIVLATFVFRSDSEATSLSDCPTENCSYLPFIGNPPAVVISEVYQTITRAGTFRFTGDVLAYKPVYDVIVEVRSLNDDFAVSGPVVLKASLPDQLNPFDIATNIDAYFMPPIEAKVIDWKIESNQIYRKATVISVSTYDDYIGIFVSADVRNDEVTPLVNVKGVIWAVDQEYGIVSTDVASILAPGETVTFTSYLRGSHHLDNVHVSAQGILQP